MLTKKQRAAVRLRLEEGWPIEKVAAFYRIGIAEVENVGQDLLNDVVYQCPEWEKLRTYLKRRLEGKTPLVDIIPRLPNLPKAERGHRLRVKLDDPETLEWLRREGLTEDFSKLQQRLRQSLIIQLQNRGLRHLIEANLDLLDEIPDREALAALRNGARADSNLQTTYLVIQFFNEIKRRKDSERRQAEAEVIDHIPPPNDQEYGAAGFIDELYFESSPTMGEYRWSWMPDPSQKVYIRPHYAKGVPPRSARKAKKGEWDKALSPHALLVRIWGQDTLDMIADDPLKEKYAHLQCPPVPMAEKIANILKANPGVRLPDLSPKEIDAWERQIIASEEGRDLPEDVEEEGETDAETVTF